MRIKGWHFSYLVLFTSMLVLSSCGVIVHKNDDHGGESDGNCESCRNNDHYSMGEFDDEGEGNVSCDIEEFVPNKNQSAIDLSGVCDDDEDSKVSMRLLSGGDFSISSSPSRWYTARPTHGRFEVRGDHIELRENGMFEAKIGSCAPIYRDYMYGRLACILDQDSLFPSANLCETFTVRKGN